MRWLALAAALALSACSQGGESDGTRERQPGPAIVSLNPCSDAILAEVADPAQILAISHFSKDRASSSMDLSKAARFSSVSGSAEEVLALKPDVVIADSFLSYSTRLALQETGIRVVTLQMPRTVEDSREQVLELARLAGNEDAGILLNANVDAALARAAPPRRNPPVPAIVWQSGGIVPGRDTLVADLLERTGFSLQSAARGMTQADFLPLEALLADPPRVIFVAGSPRTQENRLLTHPALDYLASTRRVMFDPSLLWCGGPTIVRAAELLAQTRRSL